MIFQTNNGPNSSALNESNMNAVLALQEHHRPDKHTVYDLPLVDKYKHDTVTPSSNSHGSNSLPVTVTSAIVTISSTPSTLQTPLLPPQQQGGLPSHQQEQGYQGPLSFSGEPPETPTQVKISNL